jgi:hypothetical protein
VTVKTQLQHTWTSPRCLERAHPGPKTRLELGKANFLDGSAAVPESSAMYLDLVPKVPSAAYPQHQPLQPQQTVRVNPSKRRRVQSCSGGAIR